MTPDNYTAQVRSTQTGQLLRTLNPRYTRISVVVFSPSGRQILTGDDNGQVEVWDAATGHDMRVLGTPGPAINDVEFNKSGSEFVTASDKRSRNRLGRARRPAAALDQCVPVTQHGVVQP